MSDMSATNGQSDSERKFIAEVDEFQFLAQDLEHILQRLGSWLEQLNGDLQTQRLGAAGLKPTHPLRQQADAVNTAVQTGMRAWSEQWAHLQPAQLLADAFDDKALLLVFGKFNAGKSSFCNFLADRFALHGKTVQYFHLDAGYIVDTAERFQEGSTETTARLQGVTLGEKLVLLDTPGLHSVTPENAVLTQRFTDSADGVLWLTSSASPGQVQELDELARELHRHKPLLPVVTRSDMYEEDEIDGEIKKFLRNKTPQNRALQEADVQARALEKLAAMDVDVHQLKAPVSVSVYMAREGEGDSHQTRAALEAAGFARLYDALLAITEPALAYKRRKAGEILLHHLQENVLGALDTNVSPLLAELHASVQTALLRLEQQQERIVTLAWRGVVPTLPALLEKHAAAHDVQAACDEIAVSSLIAVTDAARAQLADYEIGLDATLARIRLDGEAGFEDIVVEADGQLQVAGVDYQRLHAALEKAIHRNLLRLSAQVAEQCKAALEGLHQQVTDMQASLHVRANALLELQQELRAQHAAGAMA